MYLLVQVSDGITAAAVEVPSYIRLQANGCYGCCSEAEAQGVVADGIAYHLLGRPEMTGEEETVALIQKDAGSVIEQHRADIDYLAVMSGIDLNLEDGGGEVL